MKKVFCLLFVMLLVVGCQRYSGGEPVEPKEEKPKEEKQEEVVKEKAEPEKELTPVEQVEKIITDNLGKENNMGKETIVEINNFGSGDSNIFSLTLNASENLSTNMTKKGMWIDAIKILEPLSKIENVEMVTIMWMFPLVDQYGNQEDGKIMTMDMKKETLDKINWDNFLHDNLPGVADDYWEHPALNES